MVFTLAAERVSSSQAKQRRGTLWSSALCGAVAGDTVPSTQTLDYDHIYRVEKLMAPLSDESGSRPLAVIPPVAQREGQPSNSIAILTFLTVTSDGTDSCTGAKLSIALIPARTTCFTTGGVFSAGLPRQRYRSPASLRRARARRSTGL